MPVGVEVDVGGACPRVQQALCARLEPDEPDGAFAQLLRMHRCGPHRVTRMEFELPGAPFPLRCVAVFADRHDGATRAVVSALPFFRRAADTAAEALWRAERASA